MGPINYTGLQTDPMQAFQGGLRTSIALEELQLGRQKREQDALMEQQQQQQQQQKQLQQQQAMELFSAIAKNPRAGAAEYGQLLALAPGLKDQVKNLFDMKTSEQQAAALSDASRLHSVLRSERLDLALPMFEEKIKALENSGAPKEEIAHYKTLMDAAKEDPGAVRSMIGALISATPGGEKYFTGLKTIGDDDRADASLPVDLAAKRTTTEKAKEETTDIKAKRQFEIDNLKSQVDERKAASTDRAARLNLDREKFNLDFDSKLAELKQKGAAGATLSPGMEKLQAESVGAAITSKGMADRADSAVAALDNFKTSVGGKPLRWLAENSKKIFGAEDDFSSIKREFIRLRSNNLLADLPPGPATDRDIALVSKGYPDDNAEPEVLRAWLSSFSNVQRAVAQKEEAKSEWLSAVGTLRNAPQDITVMGTQVPAGTSFIEFTKRGIKNSGPTLDSILKKYDRSGGATGSF